MELKRYFSIALKRWWLILAGFLVVFLSVLILTYRQPFIYEAQSTFVMRPRSEFILDDEFVRALDVVSRRVEINATFAEVVGSKLIKNEAIEALGLSSEERQGLSVSGRIIGGTNILEVTARGRDPVIVRDFANAIGTETVEYVGNLYDVYQLEPLDSATIPRTPDSPKPILNLSLGAVFGLVLGASLAFLLEYLTMPHYTKDFFNIIDRESGAFNKSFLMHRLWQEISRSKRKKYPLALGLIKIEIGNADEEDADYKQIEALRMVKILSEKVLRPEDTMARFDHDTLAILLPDMTEKEAQSFMEELNLKIESVPQDSGGRHETLLLRSTVSAISYENYRMKQERFMDQAVQVMDEAIQATNGKDAFSFKNHRQHDAVN